MDDNVHMRKLVTTISCSLRCASDPRSRDPGERAWSMLREANPDIIVLDWMMEGMSGIDLVKMIRANPQSPNPFIPVIMLSGHTALEHIQQARDAGVNEFIAKPVSVKTMMSRLASVIEQPRPYVRTNSYFGPCRRRRQDEHLGTERRAPTPCRRLRRKIMARQQPIELFHAAQHAEGQGRRRSRRRCRYGRDEALAIPPWKG